MVQHLFKLRRFSLLGFLLMFVWVLSIILATAAKSAPSLQDGTYTIQYNVLHGQNDSVSMANDYWEKPASLIVKDGRINVQMRINHSSWVTQFKVAGNGGFRDVEVISTDSKSDARVTQFAVTDLNKPLEAKIHVTVESINYDHDYTIRFAFDPSSIKPSSTDKSGEKGASAGSVDQSGGKKSKPTAAAQTNSGEQTVTASQHEAQVDNPKTGDHTSLWLLATLLTGSTLFLFFRWRTRKN